MISRPPQPRQSIVIVSENICGIPSVAMVCDALRGDWDITVAGPDAGEGAVRQKVLRGLPFWTTAGVARWWSRRRGSSGPGTATAGPSLAGGRRKLDWVRFLLRFCLGTPLSLLQLLRRGRPDLIVCVDAFYLTACRLAANWHHCPYAYVMLEIYPDQNVAASRGSRRLMAMVERFGLGKAAGVLVQDQVWGRLLRIRYRLPRLQSFVVTTTPPLLDSAPLPEPPASGPLKVYYHGIYSPNRGLENVILAMKNTRNAVLAMRGFGCAEAELRELVQKEGVADRVIFLPPVAREDLPSAAVGHDAGVVSADGALGNGRFAVCFKTYEYIAAGLALLVPPSYALLPLIRRTGTGLAYKFGSPESLAAAINHLAADRSALARHQAASRHWAGECYNAAYQADALRAAVRSMTTKENPACH